MTDERNLEDKRKNKNNKNRENDFNKNFGDTFAIFKIFFLEVIANSLVLFGFNI